MSKSGFTLIELSIVLVIIGLIVGGVIVGRDLIATAEIRAQVAQIQKYNAAVNAFRTKYGFLPGDISDPQASGFGFASRGQYQGQGDGNGLIEGFMNYNGCCFSGYASSGETAALWQDLATAQMVEGSYPYNYPNNGVCSGCNGLPMSSYVPQARLKNGNYVYVFSVGTYTAVSGASWIPGGANYFGIGAVTWVGWTYAINPGLRVSQAYQIDSKIDDGSPQTGSVAAVFPAGPSGGLYAYWATGSGTTVANASGAGFQSYTAATAGDSASCFDNSANAVGTPGVAGAPQHYSTEISGGVNVTCALAIRFQ